MNLVSVKDFILTLLIWFQFIHYRWGPGFVCINYAYCWCLNIGWRWIFELRFIILFTLVILYFVLFRWTECWSQYASPHWSEYRRICWRNSCHGRNQFGRWYWWPRAIHPIWRKYTSLWWWLVIVFSLLVSIKPFNFIENQYIQELFKSKLFETMFFTVFLSINSISFILYLLFWSLFHDLCYFDTKLVFGFLSPSWCSYFWCSSWCSLDCWISYPYLFLDGSHFVYLSLIVLCVQSL